MKSSILFLLLVLGVPLAAKAQPPLDRRETWQVNEARQRYEQQKFGLFVHYVPALTVDPKTNQPVQDIDALARRFDAEQFARDAADFGVEYVIFTVHHFSARMLYPSAVNKRWRDYRRKPGSTDEKNWKTYSDTDVIAPLADALKKRNIDLHLYVHPVDGHDFSKEDQENTGWFECDSGHAKWNNFQNELFDELCKRYATRIQGLWFDGMYSHHDSNKAWHGCIDQPRFRKTLLKYNPGLILTANVAGVRDKNPASDWVAADYRAWEVGEVNSSLGLVGVNPAVNQDDAMTWPGTKEQVALVVAGPWVATNKNNNAKFSAADLYRYLVLQASVSRSGGLAVSAGCFPGSLAEQPNGTLWEGNVRETLVELNKLIAPVAQSIKNTNASKVFVTDEHQRLEQKAWGVATDAHDGSATYLHVLRQPESKTLVIGKPANAAEFSSASMLPGGMRVSLQGDADAGYTVSLPDGVAWNPLDTVIRLEVDAEATRRNLGSALRKLKASVLANPRHPHIDSARSAVQAAGKLTSDSSLREWQSNLDALRHAIGLLDEIPPPPAELNLAQSKSVQATSTHPTTHADTLTTGDRNGMAFWSSGDENARENHEESVTIDLGSEHPVGEVWLYPRQSGSTEGFPVDFGINSSYDGKSWQTLRMVKDASLPGSGHPCGYAFPVTRVRYLQIKATRLRSMSDDFNLYRMQLSRIEVFPAGR